jgi:hypothetical protein
MGLGYTAKVLEVFHPARGDHRASLIRRASALTRDIVLDKADLLEQALHLARSADLGDHDRIERETALLGLRVAAGNKIWHEALDTLIEDMHAFTQGATRPVKSKPNRKLVQAMHAVAVVSMLSATTAACGGNVETERTPVHKNDGGVDADASEDASEDEPQVYDALPYDSGMDDEPQVYDPLPSDSNDDAEVGDAEDEPQVYDALPYDGGMDASEGGKGSAKGASGGPHAILTRDRGQVVDSWRDSSPRRSIRSTDLPLFRPPSIRLRATPVDGHVRVSVEGCDEPMGLRWKADGTVTGEGESVEWLPSSPQDQICVAARTKGGIAIASLRASELA